MIKRRRRPKIALAGAGGIAVVHSLAAQSAGMKVTAVASKGGTSARHLAGQLDARRVAIDALPAGADVLIVATPPESHVDLALAGLQAGAMVLVEKPIAPTLAEADTLVDAASKSGAPRIRCAENLIHSPVWHMAMELRPDLGKLQHLSMRTVQPPPDWGHFKEPLRNGGVLFDLGPHPIAVVLGLADESPVAVSAELRSSRPDGADDWAELRIRFASGLIADLAVSWTAEDAHWDVQAASDSGVLRIELIPEVLLELNGDEVTVQPRHQVVDPRLESMGYVDQLLDLVTDDEAPRGELERRSLGQSVSEARDVLEVICAAYASAGSRGAECNLPFTGDRSLSPLQLWRG